MLRTFFVGLAAFLYSATAFGQVEFALAAAGQGDEPDIFDDEGWDGEYIRLTYDGQGNQSNGVTWPVVTPAEFGLLEFDFELRVWNEDFAGDADGIGFAFANTEEVLDDVGFWPTGEEPSLAGSIGVGFDTWMNSSLDGGVLQDGTLPNSFSLHYDGETLLTLTMEEVELDDDWIQNQSPKRAHIEVRPDGNDARLTLTVEDLDSGEIATPFDGELIPSFVPYEGQVTFRGRTGGENSNQDIDNISITHTPQGGSASTTVLFGRHVGPGGGGGPQTIVVNEGIDTTLAEAGLGGPDAPHGAEGTNPDGVERWEWDGSDGGGVNHGLLWFDIPANVLAAFGDGTATLALHVDNNGNAGDLHRVTTDWLSGPDGGDEVTWNNIPGGPGIVPGQNAEADSNAQFPDSIGRQGEVLEVDVTADVQAWAAGAPNFGWGIVPVAGDGHGITSFEHASNPVPTLTLLVSSLSAALQAGDANQDLEFNQLDLVAVQIAGTYLTGNPATWGSGDWDGAPGGSVGNPPTGNGLFDQVDIIAALNAGIYLTGPYAAVAPGGTAGDGQTSIIYNPGTGEVAVDAPAGVELTSVNIDSAGGVFTGEAAANLGGSFDNDADGNIFKATFGGSFGSTSFGNVAQTGLSQDFVLNDLTVVGSLAGGGDLGAVDLIYVPEPAAWSLLALGFSALLWRRRR